MTKFILSIAMLGTILVNNCSAQINTTKQATKAVVNANTVKVVEQPVGSNPISDVYADYINIKNSLTRDNSDSASFFAKILIIDIEKIPMDKLTPIQNTAWMKNNSKLSSDVEYIKGKADLEQQREHFISLSKIMYDLLKAFNSNTEAIYYQFCPMANDGKGAYWISENSSIVNPYFGTKMLGCGSTKETITVK